MFARKLAAICMLATVSLLAAALGARTLRAEPLVLTGGTVHTLAGEPFTGSVLVAEGVIVAAAPGVEPPTGAEVIDVTGLHVYPGLFDAFSTHGLVEISAIAATVDGSEVGAYNPQLAAAAAIHPASEVIPVSRANGITHALVAPGTRRDGVIAGQAALVHLAGWTVEEMAIEPSIAMIVEWPAIRTSSFDFTTFSRQTTPYSEAEEQAEAAREELRVWLQAARHYGQAAAAGSQRLERDLKLEALARVVDGSLPTVMIADAARDIEAALDFAEDESLRIILAGAREAWKVKERLAEEGIPVILGRVQSLPEEDDDPYDRPFQTAGELRAAGVKVAFGSAAGGGFGPSGPHSARNLPYESGTAAAFGLPRDEALLALTRYPAEILGVDDRLGTLEPGKIANIIVTDGDPLEITTRVEHLIIAGQVVSIDNRHQALYERYRARP